ncbi:hypothetical protein D3C80_311340 [compost metagenome]
MLDQFDEQFQLVRVDRRAHQRFQVVELAGRLEDRQLVPARKIGVVVRWYFQELVETLEERAFADFRGHQMFDHLRIEMVACNAHAGMADRLGRQLAGHAFEADQRIVRRASAEVGDQNIGIGLQRLGEVIGGCDRFINIMDLGKTEPCQRFVIAIRRKLLVRAGAGKMHRPASDKARDFGGPVPVRISLQPLEEDLHQIFECVATGKDQRTLEDRACGKGLDRLQETGIARIVYELADRRLSRFDLQGLRAELGILHEGERGTHRVRLACAARKLHRMGSAAAVCQRQNGIGRAEIKPERPCHGRAPCGLQK